MKKIALLGSTGSIGTQVLEVVDQNPDLFQIEILVANNSSEKLIQQAIKYNPNIVIIGNESKYAEVSEILFPKGIKVFAGSKAIEQVVQMDNVDVVVAAMVGYSGLIPVINAIKAKKQIALANKETLVVAGDIITKLCLENKVDLLPIDSEHSAIFQCLVGEKEESVEKIIITCSGGPFRNYTTEQLQNVTKKEALAHPNWNMGAKITIDSATLMNKGFEVIEAKWLFGLTPEQIDVIIHPQSVVHSLVQFCDGSLKAQLGLPDMRLPIAYALGFPNRLRNSFPKFNFINHPELTFYPPDTKKFRNLALAFEALKKGGNLACTINAANEVMVKAFLEDKVHFGDIPIVIEQTMQRVSFINKPTIDDYMATDAEARKIAAEIAKI